MQAAPVRLGPMGWIAPALAALLGVALLVALTASHGPGLDSDGAAYLAAAESLREGRGWLGVDGEPYVLWPPLQPLLLALGGALGLDQGARVVALHALALAADALLAAWIAGRLSGSRGSAGLAALAVVAVALPTATMAWSEPAFTTLVLAALAAALHWQKRRTPSALGLLGACCALALAQRYVGILLLACIALALLVESSTAAWRARLRRTSLVAALALLPVAIWAWRNARLDATPAARRGPPSDSWSYDLRSAAEQLVALEPTGAAVLSLGACTLVVLGICAALQQGWRRMELALALFPLAFTGGLVALRHVVEFDPIDARLMAPAHAVAAVLGALGVQRLLAGRARKLALAALGLWLAFALAQQVTQVSAQLDRARSAGLGLYDNASWRASAALAELRTAPPEGAGFTNEPNALYLRTGIRAHALPSRPGGYPRLYERWEREPATSRWILWFPFQGRAVLPQPENGLRLERVAAWDDAELWRVR